MKIIQTFWTKDTAAEDLLRISAGWSSPEYHWMSWALSCLQLKKFFGTVDLNTDPGGRQLLMDIFQLPFENVSTSLGKELSGYDQNLWALAKLQTYRCQEEPFLHFDSDFFLQQPLDASISNASIICQNLEKNLFFYKDTLREINQHLQFIPEPCLPENFEGTDLFSCNAGIIGGHDIAFFREYADYGFNFIRKNQGYSKFQNAANLNFVFEQYFIHWLAQKNGRQIQFLSNNIQEDPSYATHANFNNLPYNNFIHPVGGHKKSPELCAHLSKILQLDYPEYYERIVQLMFDKKIRTSVKVFSKVKGKLENVNDPSAQSITHFSRTISALKYLGEAADDRTVFEQMIHALSIPDEGAALKERIAALPVSRSSLTLLKDLYRLESKKARLFARSFSNNKAILSGLNVEIADYNITRSIFSESIDFILEDEVRVHSYAKFISVKRNWICKIPELIGQMIEDKFVETGNIKVELMLVPKFSRLYIEEYYLETLDTLLVETCKKKQTMREVARQMEQYFSAKMIAENYAGFLDLMVNTVKRLSYIGILQFVPKKSDDKTVANE